MNLYTPIPKDAEELLMQLEQIGDALEECLEHALSFESSNPRSIGIAKTEFQTGFMWLRRGLKNPDTSR